jgi:hypothetical protein
MEQHKDVLEFHTLMCVVHLCNIALGWYSNMDGKEPETVDGREWNTWYIFGGEAHNLEILRKMATS